MRTRMHVFVEGRSDIEVWRDILAGEHQVTLRIGDVMLHMSPATARQVGEHLQLVTKSATAATVA